MEALLKVKQSFYQESPNVCHSMMLHTVGGVVGGDRLSLQFHLQLDTRVLFATVAAEKIYRHNRLKATQTIHSQADAPFL